MFVACGVWWWDRVVMWAVSWFMARWWCCALIVLMVGIDFCRGWCERGRETRYCHRALRVGQPCDSLPVILTSEIVTLFKKVNFCGKSIIGNFLFWATLNEGEKGLNNYIWAISHWGYCPNNKSIHMKVFNT